MNTDERLHYILSLHFDPEDGSPYWLEKQRQLQVNIRDQVHCINDLSILGPMDADAVASRPIEDWIPRSQRDRKDFHISQTGGTLGKPKFAMHRFDEFEKAFVEPFVRAARIRDFPRGGHWLFIGPTGPHIIGRAAVACARALGAGEPFTLDFDPRWAKKLPLGSFAARRYLYHIEEQAMHILKTQKITVLFSTPAVLDSLAARISDHDREQIEGIHLGGMTAEADFVRRLRQAFPRATILSGFGNTLFGMMPQLAYDDSTGFDYFPSGNRLIARVIPDSEGCADITTLVPYGQRGRLMLHRLDEFQLIVNMVERDTAIRIPPPELPVESGFTGDGIRDPRPVITETLKPALGLY